MRKTLEQIKEIVKTIPVGKTITVQKWFCQILS